MADTSPAPAEKDRSHADARKALALLMAGEGEAGMVLYDSALQASFGHSLPVGLHLLLLERAGKDETAADLRDLALRRGGNIVLKGVAIEGDRSESAAEYEALMERGLFNTRMIEAYLMLLMRLGRFDALARFCDQPLLLRSRRLDPASGLAAAIQEALLREEAAAEYREAAQSVRNQRQISPLERIEDPAVAALLVQLRSEAASYLSAWAASDHPLARHVPSGFRLETWALISRGEGFNVPHIHHRGWATGVYYPSNLGDIPAGGELCVGPPAAAADEPAGWPHAKLRPEAGLLVLMPSYYTHWTIPLGRPGLRTAVAFDIVQEA